MQKRNFEAESEFILFLLGNSKFLSDIARKQGGHSKDYLLHAIKNGALREILSTCIAKQQIIILIVSTNEACAFCEVNLKIIRDFIPERTDFKVIYVSFKDLKDGSAGYHKLEPALSIDLFALPTIFLHVHQVACSSQLIICRICSYTLTRLFQNVNQTTRLEPLEIRRPITARL
jgi:hypothetical protein